MNSNFEYYKVFYYVSKYENLTRAAHALRTSQPAVTRTIRNLENELGCRLFTRSKTGMALTPEGQVLFRYVSEGCEQFLKGETILSNLLSPEQGNIYVSATETALHCYLFQAAQEFREQYPKVHFRILNNSSRDSIRMVKEGQADMAIISASIHVEKPLQQIVLRRYRDILIGGSRFRGLAGIKQNLSDLREYPWLSLTAESFTRKYLDDYFKQQGLAFHPSVEVDTTDMILLAAKHNLGIGFIPPEFAETMLKSQLLFEINVKEPFPQREIILIYDQEAPQTAAAKQFRLFLKEQTELVGQREKGFRIY